LGDGLFGKIPALTGSDLLAELGAREFKDLLIQGQRRGSIAHGGSSFCCDCIADRRGVTRHATDSAVAARQRFRCSVM
jgi:hypothetical protein